MFTQTEEPNSHASKRKILPEHNFSTDVIASDLGKIWQEVLNNLLKDII